MTETDRQEMLEFMDGFSRSNRYVLVSPKRMKEVSDAMMRFVDTKPWSFVLDFDHRTKEAGGLYHALQPEIEGHSQIITLAERGRKDKEYVGSGTKGHINWVMAHGLQEIYSTLADTPKEWRKKKYHHFLKEIFASFCQQSPMNLYFLVLLEEYDYVEHLVRMFDDLKESVSVRVHFCFLTRNVKFRQQLHCLAKKGYDVEIELFAMSPSDFLTVLAEHAPASMRSNACIVKTRDGQVDIAKLYSHFASEGVEPLYQSIDLSDADDGPAGESNLPTFYQGHTIRWSELAEGIDVPRAVYQSLRERVVSLLTRLPDAALLSLQHRPGAGGTTLARHLAYDLRSEFPVVMLTVYKPSHTLRLLGEFYQQVNCPFLVVAEASQTGDLSELVSQCKASKRPIVFLLVERSATRRQGRQQLSPVKLKEKMADTDEKARFLSKVKLYKPALYPPMKELSPDAIEVIDCSMAICEERYEEAKIRSYVNDYLRQMQADQALADFVTYVALIYKYAQCPVNADVFWELFRQGDEAVGLRKYFSLFPTYAEPLSKLIIERCEENDPLNEWRPRYAKFAESIVQMSLGGDMPERWYSQLPYYAKRLIGAVKQSNASLTDEVQKMLISVFLSRDKEDLLGKEEVWEPMNNTKFSQLIVDLGDTDEQKRVLLSLAEAFPDQSHFWGHLARFCYEKAETPAAFEEAIGYIDQALEQGGTQDCVILHVAGMCRRRIIEFYQHRDPEGISPDQLRELTAAARDYFTRSRTLEAENAHAYISEIQLLLTVIELGKMKSGFARYRAFLFDPDHRWYLDLYEEMTQLIDQTRILVGHQQLTELASAHRTHNFLQRSETESFRLMDDYDSAILYLRTQMAQAERDEKMRLSLIYVNMQLRKYSPTGQPEEAWGNMPLQTCEEMRSYLEAAMNYRGGNIYAMRKWIEMTRFSPLDMDLPSIKSVLKQLYEISEKAPMLHLEAAFYSYVAHAIEQIAENDHLNRQKIQTVEMWLERCGQLPEVTLSSLLCNEWLSSVDGFKGISRSRERTKVSLLDMEGTIKQILSPRQGKIQLDCGLEAFFSPRDGKIISNHDETKRVSFHLGFRYSGLYAVDVKLLDESAPLSYTAEESMASPVVEETIVLEAEPEEASACCRSCRRRCLPHRE